MHVIVVPIESRLLVLGNLECVSSGFAAVHVRKQIFFLGRKVHAVKVQVAIAQSPETIGREPLPTKDMKESYDG
jgi:hypothetical protein